MENKKINKLTIILPVLVLIVLTVSATFAYYKVTTVMNSTPAQVDVHAGNVGLVTFKNGIENLELKLTQKDMSQTNTNKIFYAVTSDTKEVDGHKYSDTEKNHTILTGSVSGTNTSEKYICEGNLTVSLSGTMVDYLQKGDVKIKLTGKNVKINDQKTLELDVKNITTENQNITLKFKVDKDNEAKITGDVMLINRDAEQKDLAGTEIEIRLDLEEKPACHIAVGDEQLDDPISLGEFCDGQPNMQECMKNNVSTIGNVKNMTSSEVGGMYRYQGTDEVNNWICFGTSKKEECTTEAGIDKYMYRIIGVTPEGELALIKETGVKETGSAYRYFQWSDKFQLTEEECGTDGSLCTWATSKLYNRLNGLCNSSNADCDGTGDGYDGQTNIFIGNNYYDYLNNNNEWLDRINTHTWKYGDTNQNNGSYNGDTIYAIENAFTDSVPNAKIGLQYLHDYYYAYPGGNPGSSSNAKNAWIHLSKDGTSGISYEWLISGYGVDGPYVAAWDVYSLGFVSRSYLGTGSNGVRPVFYLTSDIKISNSLGSKEEPFMIEM